MELLKWKWKDCGDGTTYEGICTATKADILRKAKELIDVSDEKHSKNLESLVTDIIFDELGTEGVRKRYLKFISSLFEEK